MYAHCHRLAKNLATVLALSGGVLLMLLIALNLISIIGRALVPLNLTLGPIVLGPIRGIYDMTEFGMAIALFAFLPIAQFNDAHARVDLFARFMPPRLKHSLDFLFNMCMLGFAFLMTWRLYIGMLDKRAHGEVSHIAEIPLWHGYAFGLLGASGFVFISLFCVWRSVMRILGVRSLGEHIFHD